MGKKSEITIGGIGYTKDTLLKDVLQAIYEAGKAEGYKECEAKHSTGEFTAEGYKVEVHQ